MIIQLNSITKRTVSQIRNAIKPETFDVVNETFDVVNETFDVVNETFDVVNETFDPLQGYGWDIYNPP